LFSLCAIDHHGLPTILSSLSFHPPLAIFCPTVAPLEITAPPELAIENEQETRTLKSPDIGTIHAGAFGPTLPVVW